MRVLTFIIGKYHLALPAETVASVGRSFKKGEVREQDLAGLLGLACLEADHHPVVTYRAGQQLREFKVERILGLEEVAETGLRPWPRLFAEVRMFRGIAMIRDRLFFLMDDAGIGRSGPAPAGG